MHHASTVHVCADHRGGWVVALPGRDAAVRCDTLDEARCLAYLYAAHTRPCDLVVRDAYDRVIQRDLIDRAARGR